MHLSEAVSILSYCNWALKETAVDNTDCYGEDAVNSFIQNYYIDDLLGSVSDEEYAADHLERIRRFQSNNAAR